jgi:hypothetical protein
MADFEQIRGALQASTDPRDQVKVLTQACSSMESELGNLDGKLDDVMLVLQEMPVLLKNGNHKVVLKALALLAMLVDRLNARSMQQSYQVLVHCLRDRLSHGKALVQKEALNVLVRLMHVVGAWNVFQITLKDVAGHKNYLVRRNLLALFETACAVYGGNSLNFRKVLPQVVKCLKDADVGVRRQAIAALESMYQWCGDDIMAAVETHAGNGMTDSTWKALVRSTNNTEVVPESQRVLYHEPWSAPDHASTSNPGSPAPQLRTHKQPRKSKRVSPRPYSPSQSRSHSNRLALADEGDEQKDSEWGILGSRGAKNGVDAIVCSSDRELEAIMADIGATLLVSDQAFWDRRLDALRKIEGLLLGDAHEFPSFLPSLALLHQPLIRQITDLRSAVVREACRQVCLLATTLRDKDFEACADAVLPHLVSRSTLRVDVMVSSADTAAQVIIAHSSLKKAVGTLINDAQQHKNAVIRTTSMRYLCLIVETVLADSSKHRHLRRHGYEQGIGKCVVKALGDGKSAIREQGRNTYHAYERLFPDSARDLYENHFTERTKKALATTPQASSPSPSPSSAAPARKPRVATKAARGSSRVVSSSSSSSSYSSSSSSAPPGRESLSQGSPHSSPSASSYQPRAYGRVQQEDVADHQSQAPAKPAAMRLRGGARRVADVSDPAPSKATESKKSSQGRVSLLQREAQMSKRIAALDDEHKVSAEVEASRAVQTLIDPASGSRLKAIPSMLQGKGKSKDWKERLVCLEELQALFEGPRNAQLDYHLDRIVSFMHERLVDGHHKVLNHALLTVRAMLQCTQCDPEAFKPHLERLLPHFYMCLTNTHSRIRQSANLILNDLPAVFPAAILVPVLLRVLDVRSVKVKLGALEYLLYLLPSARDLVVNTSGMMRTFTKKVGKLLDASKFDSLVGVSSKVLDFLSRLDEDLFYRECATHPKTLMRKMKQQLAAAGHMPDFGHKLEHTLRLLRKVEQENLIEQQQQEDERQQREDEVTRRQQDHLQLRANPSTTQSSRRPSSNNGSYSGMYSLDADAKNGGLLLDISDSESEADRKSISWEGRAVGRIKRQPGPASPGYLPIGRHNHEISVSSSPSMPSPQPRLAWGDTSANTSRVSDGSPVNQRLEFETPDSQRQTRPYSPQDYESPRQEAQQQQQQQLVSREEEQTPQDEGLDVEQFLGACHAQGSSAGDAIAGILQDFRYDTRRLAQLTVEGLGSREAFATVFESGLCHLLRSYVVVERGDISPSRVDVVSATLGLLLKLLELQSRSQLAWLSEFEGIPLLINLVFPIFQSSETHFAQLHAQANQLSLQITRICKDNPIPALHGVSGLLKDEHMQESGGAVALKHGIRMLAGLAGHMNQEECIATLPDTLDVLKLHIGNPNAIVRMSVIDCYVELHHTLGDDLFAYLNGLNMVHLKLIRIYINKKSTRAAR